MRLHMILQFFTTQNLNMIHQIHFLFLGFCLFKAQTNLLACCSLSLLSLNHLMRDSCLQLYLGSCPTFYSATEAEAAEYGEDCSCQGLLDRRIQSLTQESSSSGKWVFLANCQGCHSGSINCF